jgi:phage shock protein PspC (stress-responsive transcriptional regulator)
MSTKIHRSNAERAGRVFGRMWRAGARLDRKAQGWLVARGLGAGLATALLWAVKLVVIGVLLYADFWLALLLVFAVTAAWLVFNEDEAVNEQPQQMADDEHDHRKSVFYHPLSCSDDPDPRFEDD